MKLPQLQPAAMRQTGNLSLSGVTPQGCDPIKKVLCATAVAGCLATPNPVACILGVAPNCIDCL